MDRTQKLVEKWFQDSGTNPEIPDIFSQIEFFSKKKYNQYEPTSGPHPTFSERLYRWLSNVTDTADQQALFTSIPELLFIGQEEMVSLYRTAYNEIVASWISDQVGLLLDDPAMPAAFEEALENTWFCPVTDSLRINAFYKANQITGNTGNNLRPDWRALAELGDPSRIQSYLIAKKFKYIVLLEDFVGSGSELSKITDLVRTIAAIVPILIVPLLACPDGITKGRTSLKGYNATIKPVIALPDKFFVKSVMRPSEPAFHGVLRNLAIKYNPQVGSAGGGHYYGPFGYPRPDGTGAIIVMYTNTPDNTLPLIHRESEQWDALFPRSTRV